MKTRILVGRATIRGSMKLKEPVPARDCLPNINFDKPKIEDSLV